MKLQRWMARHNFASLVYHIRVFHLRVTRTERTLSTRLDTNLFHTYLDLESADEATTPIRSNL